MPLQALKFIPGTNRESTTLANEGGWFESDKVRWRSGCPEKIGGWVRDTGTAFSTLQPPSGSFWGVCRSMWNWLTLAGNNLVGLGTNLKFYLQNSTGGYFYDITPIRATKSLTNPFTAVDGSTTITVNSPGHGAVTGDFVTFSGATGLGGNITATILNAEFQVTYVSSNTFTIVSSIAANATDASGSPGGGSVTATFQITTGNEVFTFGTGWGAGLWGGVTTGVATTTLNGTINSSVTSIVLTSATGFGTSGTILIDNELITYSGVSTNTLTGCTRGTNGTIAASHTLGATVQLANTFGGWGVPAEETIATQLRTWTQTNFGQDLIFNPRNGPLYIWTVNANPNIWDRAQYLGPSTTITTSTGPVTVDSSCPVIASAVLVSDSSRFVICFGCNDYGATAQSPLLIRWSDQEDYGTWAPLATNQAGSYLLSHGSSILAAIQTRQEILVFTDSALYSMQYLGPPYVWGFQIMADNISVMSPNSVITVNNVTYWMGTDKFYMYTGRVETLPCTLRQYIFNDINLQQSFQICTGTNEGYSEIWWFYCSAGSTTVDKYVIFNHLERTWYYGTIARTAWCDSPLRATPMAAGYNGQLIYHENGNDDGSTTPASPIEAYCQSSDFDIGDGHNFGFVWRIIPDVTFDGSNVDLPSVDFTVRPRKNPGANYGASESPTVASTQNYALEQTYNVQTFTEYAYVRIRGRQMAFKISSNTLGVSWQLGTPRMDVRADGRR
jgi:hypothetical protein